jgi:hypothetical protein
LRKLVLSVVLAALFAVGGAAQAEAAKTDVRVAIGSKALFFAASIINVPVTVTCPASLGSGFIRVSLTQDVPGATATGDFFIPACTGRAVTQVVSAFAGFGVFVLDRAHVNATVFVGPLPTAASDARDVSIVLF